MRVASLVALLVLLAPHARSEPVSLEDILTLTVSVADHRVAYGPLDQQFGELWLPPGNGPFPLVILVHGGCWRKQLPGLEFVRPLAEALRARRIAVWNVEYRRVGENGGGYPGTFLDVAAAADFVRVLAERYPLDLNRLVAAGHSAGGHLVLWVAARPHIATGSPLHAQEPIALKRIVTFGALGDLKAMQEYAAAAVCGPSTIPELTDSAHRGEGAYSDTSPVNLLPLGVPTTMMVGAFDWAVPPFFDSAYRDRARAAGDAVEVVVLPEAGHFDLLAPWSPSGTRVIEAIVAAAGGTN